MSFYRLKAILNWSRGGTSRSLDRGRPAGHRRRRARFLSLERLEERSVPTVLLFQPAQGTWGDFMSLPQGYGNRVVAESQDGFLYGLDGGATPNVVVQHSTGALPQLFTWNDDFGDLHHVVFAQEPQVFEIDLVADSGFTVTLNSFDMAAWPHLDYTINSVQ